MLDGEVEVRDLDIWWSLTKGPAPSGRMNFAAANAEDGLRARFASQRRATVSSRSTWDYIPFSCVYRSQRGPPKKPGLLKQTHDGYSVKQPRSRDDP